VFIFHQDEEFVTALAICSNSVLIDLAKAERRWRWTKKNWHQLAQQSTYSLITSKCTVLELEIEQRCLQHMELKTASRSKSDFTYFSDP